MGIPINIKMKNTLLVTLPFSHSIDVSSLIRYNTIRDDGMQWDGW
ncbi:hypothetical protein OIU78_014694 [Salix suchowensis]|nr:hypothetical protein OIU78_014694 [Salix suchowensis]